MSFPTLFRYPIPHHWNKWQWSTLTSLIVGHSSAHILNASGDETEMDYLGLTEAGGLESNTDLRQYLIH